MAEVISQTVRMHSHVVYQSAGSGIVLDNLFTSDARSVTITMGHSQSNFENANKPSVMPD